MWDYEIVFVNDCNCDRLRLAHISLLYLLLVCQQVLINGECHIINVFNIFPIYAGMLSFCVQFL